MCNNIRVPPWGILVLAQRDVRATYSESKNLYQSVCTVQLKHPVLSIS